MAKHLILRSFTWTAVLTTLFVLTLGAALISLVVGDWILIHTENVALSWIIGIIVLLGYLATLGTGIGFWLWLRSPTTTSEIENRNDTMDLLLKDVAVLKKD